MELVVWTNNACSKSRGLEALLQERGIPYRTRGYLTDPPTRAQLQQVMAMLEDPQTIARPGVTGDLLTLLVEDPSRIERPVVIACDRAVVARPPERVLDLL